MPLQQRAEKLKQTLCYHCDNLSGPMLATWLNYQPDVPALGGDGEQRHFEGGDGGRRCRVDGLADNGAPGSEFR